MLIKLVFDKQIHLYKGNIKYSQLKSFCKGSFRKLPEDFHFVYFDEEGDQLMMSSNLDSVNFKSLFLHNNSKAVKLIIRANSETDLNFQMLDIQYYDQNNNQSNQKNQSQKQGYDSLANNSFQFQPLESGSSEASSQCQSLQFQEMQRQMLELQSKLQQNQHKFESISNHSIPEDLNQIYGQDFIDFQFWKQQKLQIRQIKNQKILTKISFDLIQKLVESQEKTLIQEQIKKYLEGLSQMIIQSEQIQIESEIQEMEINVQMNSFIKETAQIQVIVDQLENNKKQQDKLYDQKLQSLMEDQQKSKQNNFKLELTSIIDQKINDLLPNIMTQVEKLVQRKINQLMCQIAY